MVGKGRILMGILAVLLWASPLYSQLDQLMPVPQHVEAKDGKFRLSPDFQVVVNQAAQGRVSAAAHRFLLRLDGRTALYLPDFPQEGGLSLRGLQIDVQETAPLRLHDDESYSLEISDRRILLKAPTDLGAMHGLETLLQLLSSDAEGFYFPACAIQDAPRFPWRGLLIDVCRHWQPVDVIKRNLDAMAAMKMNVFHWHLSEDQGFRIESKRFPRLHELGSNGNYFSQAQVRDIIAYADARGIRVVPEFDIPGHATSWFVGHPELASAPGPYEIETGFGVFDPAMDPSRASTYTFLDAFIEEMAALFPDPYFHIGGDENNGKQWDANPAIQQFMKENELASNHALQAYFNTRLLSMLQARGKRMVGWDEILQPGMPQEIVIQSWRGKEALVQAAQSGYDVMLSNGYYIDLCKPAAKHYLNDPAPAELGLDAEARRHVLGGEATMWAELVSPMTIDSRIWPRTCAIAERLWSAETVRDVPDMYRRLALTSLRLEELGLRHLSYREQMARQLTGGGPTSSLLALSALTEPLKGYARHGQGVAYSTALPLNRLPDLSIPDAPVPRQFNEMVDSFLAKGGDLEIFVLRSQLRAWSDIHDRLTEQATSAPAISPMLPMSARLKALCTVGLQLLDMVEKDSPDLVRKTAILNIIEEAKQPVQESELMIVPGIEALAKKVYGL